MNDVLGGFRGEFVEIERCISCFTDRASSLMRVDTKSHRKSLLNLFPKVRQNKAGLNGSKLSQCSVTEH